MRNGFLASIRRGSLLVACGLSAVSGSAPAAAAVQTTLSFFSPANLLQGQMGAIGTRFDASTGQFVSSGSRACCFAVNAAATSGAPFQLQRTFSSLDTVSQIFYMGVSTVAAQDHLVLALNVPFSTSLVGQEFSTAFTGFSETQLITDLFDQFNQSLTVEQRIAAGNRLGAFQDQVFALNAGFGLPANFALTSFSVGVPAGSGFSRFRSTVVPEPATWAMMILGFGLVGGGLRRRSASTARA